MTPEVLPVNELAPELMFPDKIKLVPDATPSIGVINTGLILRTTEPLPVLLVTPVPPLTTGKAVPDNETLIVPEPVTGLPDTAKKLGTVTAILVTVPTVGVVQVIAIDPPA